MRWLLPVVLLVMAATMPLSHAAGDGWQHDAYVNARSSGGVCPSATAPICVGYQSSAVTHLAADSSQLDVVVADASGRAVAAILSVYAEHGQGIPIDTAPFCGSLLDHELAEDSWRAAVSFDEPSTRCAGAVPTTGTISMRADGSWEPRTMCKPLDVAYGDPDCA